MAVSVRGELASPWPDSVGWFLAACSSGLDGFGEAMSHFADLLELGPRQIQERGVLRSLDPESESEAEVLEDPCQAVQVGLELQGVVKALAVE